MCGVKAPLAEMAELIAASEFSFEEAFCRASPADRELAVAKLKRRGDMRAVKIFEEYMRPVEKAPLGIEDGVPSR